VAEKQLLDGATVSANGVRQRGALRDQGDVVISVFSAAKLGPSAVDPLWDQMHSDWGKSPRRQDPRRFVTRP
jgi:hypothetical protein